MLAADIRVNGVVKVWKLACRESRPAKDEAVFNVGQKIFPSTFNPEVLQEKLSDSKGEAEFLFIFPTV